MGYEIRNDFYIESLLRALSDRGDSVKDDGEKIRPIHCENSVVASRCISRLQASIYITRLFHLAREWSRNPICKFETREKRAI